MQLPDRKEAKSWEGLPVVDRDGTAIGRCDGVYADTDTGLPEWLDVGVPEAGRAFVPALGAQARDGAVRVAFTRALVVSAPHVGDAVQLSKADERTLYAHYGVRTTTEHSGSLLPEAADVGDDADPVTEPVRTAARRRHHDHDGRGRGRRGRGSCGSRHLGHGRHGGHRRTARHAAGQRDARARTRA